MLNYVVKEARTFYQDLCEFDMAQSLQDITAAVVSPIIGVEGEVAGAIYGTRTRGATDETRMITPLEAQVVQLLAALVGANMARAVASRTRIHFEQFFSRELVQELEHNPDLLEGREQDVTILVSDLRGFSAVSERLGARKTCQLIRDMMERLSHWILEYGGVIVDYAGDGILAMWNAPVQTADHPERACRAALAMKNELPGLNAQWSEVVGGPLSLGIGINTGIAQVGNTGSQRKFKYGPHGHSVNIASRVQEATKKLGLPVLITQSTHQLLKGEFVTRRLCHAHLAGMTEPVVLHELHGERATDEWLQQRDVYEKALSHYEAGQPCPACQSLIKLLELGEQKKEYDAPTLKLLKRAWESLENGHGPIDTVIDLSHK